MLAQIKGFAPDLDSTTPGVVVSCVGKIPTLKGLKAAPSAASHGLPALAAAATGAASLEKLDGTVRLFAGTTTKLYEANGTTSWTEVTRTSGGDYNGATDKRWRFAQFGDTSLAVQPGDKLQSIAGGSDFADITGAPQAAIVETVFQFVVLCGTNEATFGDQPNRYWFSAIGDATDWTPAASTQCVTDVLTSAPGAITAARRLGDSLIIYKRRAMYRLDYVGPPQVWRPTEVSTDVGAVSQEAVVLVSLPSGGFAHLFQGADNFYYYDGAKPVPIGNPVKDWFLGQLSNEFSGLSIASAYPKESIVRFFYPSTSISTWGGLLDKCLVYNYRSGNWGVDDRTIEGVVEHQTGGETYATIEAAYADYAALEAAFGSYGAVAWFVGQPVPLIINDSHTTQTLDGVAGTTSFTTGDIGKDDQISLITRVRPRDSTKPTSTTLTNYYRDGLGDSLTEDATTTLSSNRYDLIRSARWHRLKKTDVGDAECTGLDIQVQADGEE